MADEFESMEDMMMTMMFAVMMLGLVGGLSTSQPTPETPEPPPGEFEVAVGLTNVPTGLNYWQLALANGIWDDVSILNSEPVLVSDYQVLQTLPNTWSYPLLLDIIMYDNPPPDLQSFEKIQSAYGSDWPNYYDISIPSAGVYLLDAEAKTLTKAS